MNISKNSWHFKFLEKYTTYNTWHMEKYGVSLCSYFWRVVWELVSIGAAGLIVVALTGMAAIMMIVAPISVVFFGVAKALPMALLGGVLWTGIGLGALSTWYKSRPRKDKPRKEPGLLASYIKAKKQKVCPLVKIV